jgi:hypothetical protein
MNSVDMLRAKRASGYGDAPKPEGGERSFALTPEDNIPDGPTCVKVYGTAQAGMFTIDRIEPETSGASANEPIRVRPTSEISAG